MTTVTVDRHDFAKRAAWMVAGAVLVIGFTWDRSLDRPTASILLGLAFVYLLWDYLAIRRLKAAGARSETGTHAGESITRSVIMFAVGAMLIVIGSRLLVTSGQTVAAALGIPSAIIGFSVIAIGTSLPELVTGVTAARKGEPDLALGNIIGANVLNLLLIVGLSGVIEPLTLEPFSQFYAFPWMVGFFGLVVILIWRNGRIEKRAGSALLVLYLLYLAGLVLSPMVLG
jgi:cation:H+ antiporter